MAQEMSQCFFGIMILMYFIITVKSEVYHLLPAPSNTCKVDFHDCLTLSQFVSNSSNYLSKTTMLIFAPGSHAIESELIIENIYSFSMLAETTPLTQTEIVCYDHANFTFSHVSVVTVIGFKFSGCIGNQILSVSKFHLKKSTFYGGVKINDCGTVLTMAKTVSHLERVSFTFHHIIEQQTQNHTMIVRCTDICPGVNLYTNAIAITQSLFIGNQWRILYSKHDSDISILSSTFTSNEAYLGGILYVTSGSTINLNTCSFKKCKGDVLEAVDAVVTIIHSLFLNTLISHDIVFYTRDSALKTSHNNDSQLLSTRNTNLKVSHSEFIGNANNIILLIRGGSISIHHCQFIRTVASATPCLIQYAEMLSIRHNEFKSNNVFHGIVNVYESTDEPIISNNDFVDNNAVFDTYISSDCKLGLSLSPDSSRCIPCPDYWRGNLIGIVVAAFVAGLALVIVIFAFNMTIAVGTLNGILLYGNIIAANADIYFLPFSSPNFVTVFISWLSLDVGFDICFFKGMDKYDKAQIQLAFPVYIILLVIIVIILSECSTKFARIVGKGNPIAVLTTMILISYTKFFNVIIGSISLLYLKPAYGSRNLNITRFDQYKQTHPESTAIDKKHYSMLIFAPIIFFIGVLYTTLVFSWQWLLYSGRTSPSLNGLNTKTAALHGASPCPLHLKALLLDWSVATCTCCLVL